MRNVIKELNKQREVQKELIIRRNILTDQIDISTRDFEEVTSRLRDVNEIIKQLRKEL